MDYASMSRGTLLFLRALAVLATAVLAVGCASGREGAGKFGTVVVDAGHGGSDRGGRSIRGAPEKVLALDTSRRLAQLLRRHGFRVIETRTQDVFVPLPARTRISNRAGRAIFVSIHYNWARRSGARGVEIYYLTRQSRRLAANIYARSVRSYSTIGRGLKRARFHVLRNNRNPAVLCELGFVTNPADNRQVQNSRTRQRLAEAIAAGIVAERQAAGH